MFRKIGNSLARSVCRKSVGRKSVVTWKSVSRKVAAILGSFVLAWFTQSALGQSAANSSGLELPLIMRQKVVAGVTPVGTVVQAKLTVATLVDGVVVPENAILSGEVTESVARSVTDPSRLAIRMDSAQWKTHGAPKVLNLTKKVYLTAWSYPATSTLPADLAYQPPDLSTGQRSRGRMGSNPSAPPPTQRLPGADDSSDTTASTAPPASTSTSSAAPHRVLMKDVESTRAQDGTVALTSRHSNIKLDKSTTYVFAGGELASGPV
jgi:hypothetical protein